MDSSTGQGQVFFFNIKNTLQSLYLKCLFFGKYKKLIINYMGKTRWKETIGDILAELSYNDIVYKYLNNGRKVKLGTNITKSWNYDCVTIFFIKILTIAIYPFSNFRKWIIKLNSISFLLFQKIIRTFVNLSNKTLYKQYT